MKPFIRTPYNYDTFAASQQHGTANADPKKGAVQSTKAEADINVMIKRFGVTQVIQGVQMPPPIEEFVDVFDFQGAQNVIRRSQESFNALSAETRARFSNDAGVFYSFATARNADGTLTNLEELRKMGLAVPPKPAPVKPEPAEVRIVNPEAIPK